MNQNYDIVFDTPKYHRTGTATITYKGDSATVRLDVAEFGVIEAAGTRDDKNFEVSGTKEIEGTGPITFTAKGQTWGNSLDCTAETSIGTVTVYGTATGHSAGDVPGVTSKYYAGLWSDGM